jgi:hypothetical protein
MPRALTAVSLLFGGLPGTAVAQHAEHGAADQQRPAVELSQSRTASGTAWLPVAERVPGYHTAAGRWAFMLHGAAFLQYLQSFGTRSASQLGSANWVMVMATRPVAGGQLRLRVMGTAEPFTLTGRGYPQPLQVAHDYRGAPAPDRQHPHELVAELSAAYEWAASDALAISVYAAPVGEPALGPVAYNHRPSAAPEPVAPLGHVAQDYTHESLGVVTIGVFGRRARFEASLFNGSHPDDEHTNLDLQGGKLNALAGRFTWAPSATLTGAIWLAAIPEVTGAHAHEAERRFGASLLLARPQPGGAWSTTLLYGAVVAEGESVRHTVLVESSLDLSLVQAVYGRAEYVRRTSEELALTGAVPDALDLGAVSFGTARRLWRSRGLYASVGARVTTHFIPPSLEPFYGSRTPLAVLVYVRVAPPTP